MALYNLSYGLFVISARESDKDNGCIANTCFQVAENPNHLAISMQKKNLTREMIENTGIFNVSVLTESVPFETIRYFGMQSGRDTDKFGGAYKTERSHNGLVYLTENTNAMFSCEVISKQDLGTHILMVGKVTESKVLSKDPSCTYAYYHKAIKPKF